MVRRRFDLPLFEGHVRLFSGPREPRRETKRHTNSGHIGRFPKGGAYPLLGSEPRRVGVDPLPRGRLRRPQRWPGQDRLFPWHLGAERHSSSPTKQIPLSKRNAKVLQYAQIGELLDTFRDNLCAHFDGERQNGAGERLLTAMAMDACNQRDVELYDVGFEPEEMAESGIAGSKIVR